MKKFLFLLSIIFGVNAYAAVNDRLERIERDLLTLQKQFYRSGDVPNQLQDEYRVEKNSIASLEARFGKIEEQLRNISGQTELLEHNYNTLNEKLEKLSKEIEFRFQALEKSKTNSEETGAIKQDLSLSNGPSELGGIEKEQFDEAFDLMKAAKFDEAEKSFSKFIEAYPEHSLSGAAYYWLGEMAFKKKDYDKSAKEFLRGYKKFPKGKKAADSLFKLGVSLINLHKNKEACVILAKLAAEFPQNETLNNSAKQEAAKIGCSK